jgi:hypothetical protein
MHFNHVIKPQEQKVLARPYLVKFMMRGAAALGVDSQTDFKAVFPYLYGSTNLNTQNAGFIIVQVKYNLNTAQSIDEVFQKMDPFQCNLINNSDKIDGRFPIPIIRLVFLLAEKESSFTQWTHKSPSQGATTLEDGRPLFTSYDYVCSGISPSHLGPTVDSYDIWKVLVKAQDWKSFFCPVWLDPSLEFTTIVV